MKIFHLKASLAAMVFAALVLVIPQVSAQKFLEEYKKPMPDIALMPEAEFAEKTTAYKDAPLGDKALAYEARLPKDWKKSKETGLSNDSLTSKILGEVVRFYGPPTGDFRSYFSVVSANLEYRVTAEQWLIQYFISNSYMIEGLKTYSDRKSEALYVYNEKELSYVVRTVAQINGKRIILAQYFLPYDRWEQEKQTQAQIIQDFKLSNDVVEDIEKMKKYHFLDIAQFDYPETWTISADPLKSIDRMRVQVFSIASEEVIRRKKYKTLNGKMTVSIVSYYIVDSMDDEIRKFKNEIQKTGLMLQDKIETREDFKVGKNMEAMPVEVYNTVDRENDILNYELWMDVLVSGDFYYFVTLLTPSRDEDYVTWSKNVETFRTLLESLTPQEGSLAEE